MQRYYLSSAAAHILLVAAILLSPFFRRAQGPSMMIEGFEYVGGGSGTSSGTSGPKKEEMGQVVPEPVKVPIIEKPAPVQKVAKAEDTWKVQNKPTPPKAQKTPPKQEPIVERGEKTQVEKTNIIRRGVAPDTKAGAGGFDFGSGETGTKADGKGVGIGLGSGDGPGFGGFGGYLRIVRQRIWGEWTQSAVIGSNEVCIVGLTIHKDGEVTDIAIEKASGNGFYDSVALRAVRNASPLPPLPESFPKSEQRFRIQFQLTE